MIKEYKKKDGSKAYMFVAYLGVDPITGKQRRTTRRGFKTRREANIAKARLQTEVAEQGTNYTQDANFAQIYQLWNEQYKHSVKPSTLNRVNNNFKVGILPHFGKMKLRDISPSYCQSVVLKWIDKYKYVENFIQLTSSIFDYAIHMQIIKSNPFKLIKTPRREKTPKIADGLYYTKDELKTFLSYLDGKDYYIFHLLAYTGMRRGELLALQWNDIDFNQKLLTVSKTLAVDANGEYIVQTPKSTASYRTITLDNSTINLLKKWKHTQQVEMLKFGYNTNKSDQLVFTNDNNQHLYITYLTYRLNSICKQHNFKKIKVHGFRHTHCSLLFEAGASIQEVKERLGHSHINTTMSVYAHVTPTQRDTLADKFEAYIG